MKMNYLIFLLSIFAGCLNGAKHHHVASQAIGYNDTFTNALHIDSTKKLSWNFDADSKISSCIEANNSIYICSVSGVLYQLDTFGRVVNKIHSIPVGDIIYINDSVLCMATLSDTLFGIDIKHHKTLWKTSKGNRLSVNIICWNGNLFFSCNRYIYCINPLNGNVINKYDVTKELGGGSFDPVASKNAVYFFTNDTIYYLDKSGNVYKKVENSKFSFYNSAIHGDTLFNNLHSRELVALDLKTGSIIWTKMVNQLRSVDMICTDSLLFADTDLKEISAFKVDNGQPLWSKNCNCVLPHSFFIHNTYLCFNCQNKFNVINLKTQRQKVEITAPGFIEGQPFILNRTLYLIYRNTLLAIQGW